MNVTRKKISNVLYRRKKFALEDIKDSYACKALELYKQRCGNYSCFPCLLFSFDSTITGNTFVFLWKPLVISFAVDFGPGACEPFLLND